MHVFILLVYSDQKATKKIHGVFHEKWNVFSYSPSVLNILNVWNCSATAHQYLKDKKLLVARVTITVNSFYWMFDIFIYLVVIFYFRDKCFEPPNSQKTQNSKRIWKLKKRLNYCYIFTAWEVSKYGVFADPYFRLFSPNTAK